MSDKINEFSKFLKQRKLDYAYSIGDDYTSQDIINEIVNIKREFEKKFDRKT